MIEFYKYEGAGNDFIMIDDIHCQFKGDKKKLAQKLCKRHFGVGSDGLIFIEPSEKVDFIMNFFNPDGSQSFCGNGSRCAVAFAKELGLFSGSKTTFQAIDGLHTAEIVDSNVKISMQDVEFIEAIQKDVYMDTGSPHYVTEVDDVDQSDLLAIGRLIRYDAKFEPGGTNVNLIQKISDNSIASRTYERGVEDETLACGTGATAAALTFARKQGIDTGVIFLKARGGDLKVHFEKTNTGYQNIFLEGPAKKVFKGVIDD